jgi:serpin B
MRTRLLAATVLTAVAVAASACSAGPAAGNGPVTHYPSTVQQQSIGNGAVHLVVAHGAAPAPDGAEATAVADDEQAFSLALTEALYRAGGNGSNVLTSPLGADVALSMLQPGARGATAVAIAKALQATSLSTAEAGGGWAALLASYSRDLGPVHLDIADSIWLQDGVPFREAYLSELARDFGNAAYQADFARDLPGAVAAVNQWVASETAGRITQLLTPGSLGTDTIAVLANALRFKAQWDQSLNFEADTTEPFHTAAGATVSVPAMTDQGNIDSEVTKSLTAIDLPYAGGRFSALIVEPSGSLASYLAGVTPAVLGQVVAGLRAQRIDLELPTLSLSDDFSMERALSALGMAPMFSPGADLSGISSEAANVGAVVQANRLDLTSWGTDFASATAVGIAGSAAPAPAPRVTVDRPYLFMIRDDDTGAILASAVVGNPLAGA